MKKILLIMSLVVMVTLTGCVSESDHEHDEEHDHSVDPSIYMTIQWKLKEA